MGRHGNFASSVPPAPLFICGNKECQHLSLSVHLRSKDTSSKRCNQRYKEVGCAFYVSHEWLFSLCWTKQRQHTYSKILKVFSEFISLELSPPWGTLSSFLVKTLREVWDQTTDSHTQGRTETDENIPELFPLAGFIFKADKSITTKA